MIIDEEFKLNLKKLFGYEDLKNKDLNIEEKLSSIFEFLNYVNAIISWKMLENGNLAVENKTVIKLIEENH